MSQHDSSSAPDTPPLSVYNEAYGLASAYKRRGRLAQAARVRHLLNEPALSARRPIYVAAALLIIAAFWLHFAPLLVAGVLVLAVAIVPEVWYIFAIRGLSFKRAPEVSRASFLDVVETALELENRGLLPLPFVDVMDTFPAELPTLGMTLDVSPLPERAQLAQSVGLWAFQRVRRRFYLRAAQRGVFTFGPTTLKVTDPFGILAREESGATERALIVHPLVVPLDQIGLTPKALFGERLSRVRLLEDPLRLAGVREYTAGDDPRRIHWKASARTGMLQSKLLDPSTQRTMMIALDVRTYKVAHMGYDPALSELAITVAASLATQAFNEGYAVGIIANGSLATLPGDEARASGVGGIDGVDSVAAGEPRLRLEPSARPEHLTNILDGLARLLPYSSASLAQTLTRERRVLPLGASLVYVGLESLVDVSTLIALREIRSRGRDVSLVLTTREEEIDEGEGGVHLLRSGMFATHYIGGRAKWRELAEAARGALPYRRASAPLTEEQLALERAVIAAYKQTHLRKSGGQTASEALTHALASTVGETAVDARAPEQMEAHA